MTDDVRGHGEDGLREALTVCRDVLYPRIPRLGPEGPHSIEEQREYEDIGGAWDMANRALSATPIQPGRGMVEALREALDVLSGLSSFLGAGMGDDSTTAEQFDKRIRWGIDHIGSVYRSRAAQVVEECSKRPSTTWGQVKRAILDDTALPNALSSLDSKGEGQ